MDNDTDWIDSNNKNQCRWTISYLKKIPHVKFERYGSGNMIRNIESAFYSIPRTQKKERKRLMKAAWAQQNLQSDGRVSRQYRLNKQSIKSLESIAKRNKANLNKTIELLIDNEYEEINTTRAMYSEINIKAQNLSEDKISKLEKRSKKQINKLEQKFDEQQQEITNLKKILKNHLIGHAIFKARLISNECSGSLSKTKSNKIKENVYNMLLKKGVTLE